MRVCCYCLETKLNGYFNICDPCECGEWMCDECVDKCGEEDEKYQEDNEYSCICYDCWKERIREFRNGCDCGNKVCNKKQ